MSVMHRALLPPSLSIPHTAEKGQPPTGHTTVQVSEVSEVKQEAKTKKGILFTSSMVLSRARVPCSPLPCNQPAGQGREPDISHLAY